MANVDGSIRISVDLDTKNFSKSIGYIEKEFSLIGKSAEALISSFSRGGDTSKFTAGLQSIATRVTALNLAVSDVKNKFSGIDSLTFNSSLGNINKMQNAVGELFDALEREYDVKIDFLSDNEADVKKVYTDLRRSMSGLSLNPSIVPSIDTSKVKSSLSSVSSSAKQTAGEMGMSFEDALKSIDDDIKSGKLKDIFSNASVDIPVDADVSEAKKEIESLDDTPINLGGDSEGGLDLSSMLGSSSKLNSTFSSISSTAGAFVTSLKATIEIVKKIYQFGDFIFKGLEKTYSRVKKINETITDSVKGLANVSKSVLNFATDMTSALGVTDQLNDAMHSLGFGDLVGAELLTDVIRDLLNEIKTFTSESVEYASGFQSYYLRIKDIFGESKQVIYDYAKDSTLMLGMSETAFMEAASKIGIFAKSYITDVEDLSNVTVGLTTAIADLSAQTGFSIDETMQKVLSGLRGNTEAIEELGINVKVADMQNWLNTQGLNVTFEQLNSNMQNLYRTWYLLDKIQSNGTVGYASKMMNTYSGQVRILQAQISDLKTTIGTYLMQALVPVIQLANMLISRFIDLSNVIGETFGLSSKYKLADGIGTADTSAVSGLYADAQESISGAVSEQEKLTEETNKTAEAAKKALAPFHKLNVLKSNSSSSSSSTPTTTQTPAIGGIGSILDVTTESLGDTNKVVSEWLTSMKKAIADGEWENVGKLLASKVNSLFSKINLVKYQNKIDGFARNIARTLNGFIAELDFATIGRTVSQGVNVISSAINKFVESVDWVEIGIKLSDFSRELFTTIDWVALGDMWSSKTEILLGILRGFVRDMSEIDPETGLTGWKEAGSSVADFVNGILDLNWATFGTTVGTGLSGLLTSFNTFLADFSLPGFTAELATGFNNSVYTLTNGETKVSEAGSNLLNEITQGLDTLIYETDWSALGTAISDGIFGTLANFNWDSAVLLVYDALTAALDFGKGFAETLEENAPKIKEGIAELIATIANFLTEHKDEIAETINSIVGSLEDILVDQDWNWLISTIGGILGELDWASILTLINLPELLMSGLKLQFGSSAIIGGLKQIGGGIVQGIWEGITGLFEWLWGGISGFFTDIVNNIKDFFGIHSPSTVFEEIGGFLIEGLWIGVEDLWEKAKKVFTDISSFIVGIFTSLGDLLKKPINAILSVIESMVNGIIGGINAAINFLNGFSVDIPDWVPVLGGQKLGFDLKELSKVTLPRLADGAVIKPNHRFIAELGDQTQGVNIETPLNTMLTAFRTALADGDYGSTGDIVVPVYIGDEMLDEVVVKANQRANFRNNGRQ